MVPKLLIVGCTELSIPLRNQNIQLPVIDSTDVLALAAVKRARRLARN